MVTRPASKEDVVEKLHNFIMQHNREIGLAAGVPQEEVDTILENNKASNKVLCEHLYDMLLVEGYLEHE